jgi:ubiquinone/menaquinone biosynthesis C-methylase UbiE
MMIDYDPRIVALYDGDNPDGPDHDYYRSLAADHGAQSILDLGCGTGMLTVTLVAPGRTVVGVDPSASMISYARQRSGADAVSWIEGDASDLASGPFDLMVMTGNVAQHIPDPHWERTLRELRRVASAGALLAFESRNPSVRAWESWAQEQPTTRDTMFGPLTEWYETDVPNEGQVLLRSFNQFEATKEVVGENQLLTFRSVDVLTAQLVAAGFEVSSVWGDWERTPFDGDQGVMVVEARPV